MGGWVILCTYVEDNEEGYCTNRSNLQHLPNRLTNVEGHSAYDIWHGLID